MILTGPSPVIVTPGNPAVHVQVIVDLDGGSVTASYGPQGGQGTKEVSAPIPPALRNALETWAKGAIEINEGWAGGSSTITTP